MYRHDQWCDPDMEAGDPALVHVHLVVVIRISHIIRIRLLTAHSCLELPAGPAGSFAS